MDRERFTFRVGGGSKIVDREADGEIGRERRRKYKLSLWFNLSLIFSMILFLIFCCFEICHT